jgi:hypothetical protein
MSLSSRITPKPAKIDAPAVDKAMAAYAYFYKLHIEPLDRDLEELRGAVATMYESVGLEEEAVEHFLNNVGYLIPDCGDLQSIIDGATWLGFILGLSAAQNAKEGQTWPDTPNTVAELLARTEGNE